MNRKLFWLIAAILIAFLDRAEAQQPLKTKKIGYMAPFSADPSRQAFVQRLNELGYLEGKNITIEYRYPEGRGQQLKLSRPASWSG